MVDRALEPESFDRAKTKGRVLARVEEHRGSHRAAEPVEHLERDRVVGLGLRIGNDRVEPDRPFRRCHACVAGQAVAHRSGRIAVDRPEVSLAVDERIAHRERLGETDERVIDRGIAVWVVIAHHVADDAGGLSRRPVRLQAGLVHRIEDAAVHGLQPVADVRQCAAHDHAHRVVEEAGANLLIELARLDAAGAQWFVCQVRHFSKLHQAKR